jgi:hypothetical protein
LADVVLPYINMLYRMFMPKQPLSVTLDQDNLLWLRGRAASRKRKSLSDALDEILTAARLGGLPANVSRSVVGTADIAADDPDLTHADVYLRELFSASAAQPRRVHERPVTGAVKQRTRRRG